MSALSIKLYPNLKYSSFVYNLASRHRPSHFSTSSPLYQFVPDKSLQPKLNEDDLEEQFVQGSGPGGQNVNRLQNCVVLKHLPTGNRLFVLIYVANWFLILGLIVRCHQDRLQQRNRKLARQLLLDKLDRHLNGDQAVSAQKERYILARKESIAKRNAELRQLKKAYKDAISIRKEDLNQPLE